MLAAGRGHIEVLKVLDRAGADMSGKNHKQKKTPLIFACANGHLDIVTYLLDKC
jgi:ankyrin repeat protein